jgi:hypothetical protein
MPVLILRRLWHMGQRAIWLPIVLGFFALFSMPALAATVVKAHFFWSAERPHCRDMAASLDGVIAADPDIVIERHEVSHDPAGAREFARTVERLNLPPVVLIVVIGKEVMVGHEPGAEARLRDMIGICRAGPCPDFVAEPSGKPASQQVKQSQASPVAYTPQLPSAGYRRSQNFGFVPAGSSPSPWQPSTGSTPAPCGCWCSLSACCWASATEGGCGCWQAPSYWRRPGSISCSWPLGSMSLLILGALAWLRVVIGVLAIGAGGHYVREALRREQVCEVTQPGRRRKIPGPVAGAGPRAPSSRFDAGRCPAGNCGQSRRIDLLCRDSSRLYRYPLAQSDLSAASYYGYLGLYILVFLADDAALVVDCDDHFENGFG